MSAFPGIALALKSETAGARKEPMLAVREWSAACQSRDRLVKLLGFRGLDLKVFAGAMPGLHRKVK